MLQTVELKKASDALFKGTSIVDQSFTQAQGDVAKVRADIAGLDSSSPVYHLRMKTVSGLFEKVRQDVTNLSNVVNSTNAALQRTSLGLEGLNQRVRLMELDHEMATAGGAKKAYLVTSRAICAVYSSVISVADFFKVGRDTTNAVGLSLLSGAVAFTAGYLAASEGPLIDLRGVY